MGMSDDVWRRHVNPWSGWSRATALPLFALAIWSRVWLGWGAWVPVVLVLIWIWVNPRVFKCPERVNNWMSRGVLGEYIYLNHAAELPAHQMRAARVLGWMALPGIVVMVLGLILLWWEGVVFGTVFAVLPKFWFLDRMVWIYDNWMRSGHEVLGIKNNGISDV
tara:strand:+ start:82897 stop:83388 length:492 start_codon:yes stop_codon:yes gene_type:complete